MASIGWATLQVIPSMQGATGQMTSQIVGPMRTAGQAAGQAAGQGIAGGIAGARAQVEKASESLAKATDKVADATGRRGLAEKTLQKLIDDGVTDTVRLATATERLESAKRKEAAAMRDADKATRNLSEAEERAANATDEIADSAESATRGLKGLFSGLDSGTKKLAGFAAGAAGLGGAVDLGMKSLENGATFDKMAAQMGATGDLAKEYGKEAGALYSQGLGTSMEDAALAVQSVAVAFPVAGFEGEKALGEISASAMKFSDIFDTDVSESVQSAAQLVNNGLAKDSTEAFDLMTAAAQRVGPAMRDELPELMGEYGTFFSSLGFNGQEAFGMLVNASAEGAIAMDKVGDALKETGIKASDLGDQGAQDALKSLGLDAQLVANDLLIGGEQGKYAFQQMVDGLLSVEDPAKQAEAAIALFGTPLEDLNKAEIPAFLEAMGGAGDSMIGFEGSLESASETMNQGPLAAMQSFGRGLEENVTSMLGDNVMPILGQFTGMLDENEGSMLGAIAGMTGMGGAVAGFETAKGTFDSVKEGAMGLKDGFVSAKDTAVGLADNVKKGVSAVKDFDVASKLSSATTKIWSGIQLAFNVIMSANPVMLIVVGIGLLIAAVVLIATKTTWFQTIWDAVWGGITATWDWAWGKLQEGWELLKQAFGAIGDKVTQVKDWIVGKWNELVDFVTGLPGRVAASASGMWQSILDSAGAAKDWVVGKFDEVVGFVTGLPGRITSAVSGMWDGIKEAFKNALNWVINKWNNFKIPAAKIAGVQVSPEINFPDLPLLASGGIAGRRKDGTLWGPGTGTSDSILGIDQWGMPTALVSTDEGVVNARAMANGGSELVGALNAGWTPSAAELHTMFPDLPKFAGGGVLGGIQAGANQRKPVDVYRDWSMVPTTPQAPAPVNPEVFGGTNWTPPAQNSGAGNGVQNTGVSGPSGASGTQGAPAPSGAPSGGGGVGEPYGLPTGSSISYGSAGFPDWVTSLGSTYGLQASTYPGHQEGDRGEAGYAPNPEHLNRGIDWSGPVDKMQAYAEWLLSIAPKNDGLEQIIWQNPNTGQKIGWAGRSEDYSGSYFASDYSGHQDHVHTRTSTSIGDVAAEPEVAPTSPESTGASTSALAGTTSTTTETTTSPEKQKVFSARDRIKTMFTDVAGIWADSAIEIFGVGEWLDLADRYTITPGTTSSSTSQSETMSNAEADAAIVAGTKDPVDTTVRTGHDLYAYEIARAAKDMGLPESAAVIGEATALVEVGDPLKMYANSGLPASVLLPHDAVGSNGTSTGLFQQQDFPEWGTLEQRMNPFESAKLFYEKFPQNWETMDPGAVAQAVQRSAFPSKYADMMGRGKELVDNTSLYDTGGWLMPGEFGFNGLNEPEPVLKNAHWKIAESNISKVDELVGAGVGGGPRVQIVNNNNQVIADQATWQRDQASQQRLALMRFGG